MARKSGPVDVAVQRAELKALRAAAMQAIEVLKLSDHGGLRAAAFVGLPEDAEVLELCERHGFGAVMDSAARQWRQRDPCGAHTTGACPPTIHRALEMLRAALQMKKARRR